MSDVEQIANVLAHHHQVKLGKGGCTCGHDVGLGRMFWQHPAAEIIKALRLAARLAAVEALCDEVDEARRMSDAEVAARGWLPDFVDGQLNLVIGIRRALAEEGVEPR